MLALTFVGCGGVPDDRSPPPIIDGTMDLRGWDFERDGSVNLTGDWLFAWRRFVSVAAWPELRTQLPLALGVPKSWEHYPELLQSDGQVPGLGYGTYALRILWDDSVQLALLNDGPQFAGIIEAYTPELELVARLIRGQPAATAAEELAYNRFYSMLPLNVKEAPGELILMVHVSSHSYPRGGIRRVVQLDRLSDAKATLGKHFAQASLTLGVLVIIGLYHFILFLLRRQQLRALYFALFCFAVALRETVMSGILTSVGLSSSALRYAWLFKIEYAAIPAMVVFCGTYVSSLLPDKWFRRFVWWISGVLGGVLVLLALVEEAGRLPRYLEFYQGHVVLGLVVAVVYIVMRAWQRYPFAKSILFSFGVIAAGAINDILHTNSIIQTAFIASYSVIAFVLLQSIILSRANAKAHAERDELMSRVMEQTSRLAEESQRRANAELEARVEAESKILLFSNAVHHLNNPLNHIQGVSRMAANRAENLERAILELLGDETDDPVAAQVRAQFASEFNVLADDFEVLTNAAHRSANTVKLLRIVSGMDGASTEPSSIGELCRILDIRLTGSLQGLLRDLGMEHAGTMVVGHPLLYAEAIELIEGACRQLGLSVETLRLERRDARAILCFGIPGVEVEEAIDGVDATAQPFGRAGELIKLLLKAYGSELKVLDNSVELDLECL